MSSDFNYAGSRWWKFDFHCHTPASDDYGKGPDQEILKQITPEEWLLTYMREGIDCVAITDHNSGKWIDKLKDAYSGMDIESYPDFRPIHIFPGVEISANGGVHILSILHEDKGTSDVASLLGGVGYRGTHGKCETCTDRSANEVISEIIHSGSIAIPAHVDSPKGIFYEEDGNRLLDSQTLEKILSINDLIAMELIDKSFSKPELYSSKKINFTEVLGSDSHYPHDSGAPDNRFPGSHFTWVKMSEPNLEGLRLALLDGNELSIRRSDEDGIQNPNQFDHLIIESITIENACYMGNGNPFVCNFSPWLNTIIGGRGTGKSTILEFIRLCLQRKDDPPKGIKVELSKYCKIRESRGDEGLIKANTIISVIILKDQARYKIIWDTNNPNGLILLESPTSEWISNEGDIKQRFPIKIFSQKEIFELSKDQQTLLKIIDEASEVDFKELNNNIEKVKNGFLLLRAQIREKESEIKEESTLKGELQDINNKIAILEQSGYKDKLTKYNSAIKRKKEIESWKESIIDIKDTVKDSLEKFTIIEIDQSLFENDSHFIEEYKNSNLKISEILIKLRNITKDVEGIIADFNTEFEKTEIYNEINTADSEYHQLIDELEKEGINDINKYQSLISKRELIQDKLDAIERISQEKEELFKKSENYLTCINDYRKKISENRQKFVETVLSSNALISIEVLPYGNLNDFTTSLRKIIGKETSFDKDIEELKTTIGGCSDKLEGLKQIKDKILDIYSGKDSPVKDERFSSHIIGLEPEVIDRLICFYPEDGLNVKYYDQKSQKYMPIKRGSPGQKTAAILSFLLAYGNEPLILDQPEDDLENRLIYDLIVTQIKKTKNNRQIIIVTHNANIVVNGDSENLIPLTIGQNNTQTYIQGQGGLQEKEIRNEICNVLEGGIEAFKLRYKRINLQ